MNVRTEYCLLSAAFTGFETNNKYEIRNVMGQRVYMAVEGESGFVNVALFVTALSLPCAVELCGLEESSLLLSLVMVG